ncbi:MAG: hypothetical protein WCG22_04785, partial [Lentisphaerota bacterium]
FQFSAFQHFSFSLQRGRRRLTSLRADPDPMRAAPFSFQLFSFSAFLFGGTPSPALCARIKSASTRMHSGRSSAARDDADLAPE